MQKITDNYAVITDILNYIENNLKRSRTIPKKQHLSVMHLDMHQSDMQRAMAFVFEGSNRYPKYVVKYPKCHEYTNQLLDEFNRYSEIYERLSPDLKRHLHLPICIYNEGNNFATIEEGLPGASLLLLMKKNYNEKKILSYFDQSFGFLIKFQNETCSNNAPSKEYLKQNLESPIELFCNRFSLSYAEKKTVSFVKDKVIDFLIRSESLSACHGDYWPNNILIYNGQLFVVDWANCTNSFFRFWDFYSLIYMTTISGAKTELQYCEMCDFYLNQIGIGSDIDSEIRIIYCAIRSVWNEFLFNEVGLWDSKWKNEFDIELSKYVER